VYRPNATGESGSASHSIYTADNKNSQTSRAERIGKHQPSRVSVHHLGHRSLVGLLGCRARKPMGTIRWQPLTGSLQRRHRLCAQGQESDFNGREMLQRASEKQVWQHTSSTCSLLRRQSKVHGSHGNLEKLPKASPSPSMHKHHSRLGIARCSRSSSHRLRVGCGGRRLTRLIANVSVNFFFLSFEKFDEKPPLQKDLADGATTQTWARNPRCKPVDALPAVFTTTLLLHSCSVACSVN
jgi:hypothetical protein